jgi:Transposase DDE domain
LGWWLAGGDSGDEAAKDRRCTHNVDLQGEGLVCAVLDDLVIALYVTVDELVEPRRGPGCRPRLSDPELVCLAVAQVLLGYDSERRWPRAVADRLGHLFPYICGQAAYNRRLRRAAPLVANIPRALAVASPSWCDQWRLLDATPVSCGQSRETVKRSALAGHAGYGYDASHHRFYWGLKLYVLAAPDGMPVAWCLANPSQGEREVAEGLLDRAARQGVLRPGMVILADKGLAGREFQALVGELGATLARPDRADEPYRFGSLGGVRQWVEAIFDTLKDQLGLEHHGARTIHGAWIRVAQRLLALAACVWFNWQLGAPVKRSLVAFDH